MPGFDGTGPMGMGPMTGGGRGFCVTTAGGMRPGFSGRRSFGRGGGRGRGRRNWYYATGMNYMPYLSEKDEAQMLKGEAELLREELGVIQERLAALEKAQGPKADE
ncbi:MAG: DUF5320 family protein [Candidatus Omnitrophica bacterium]|nr:DUF5320 family protein [Candidatus Omnitrophota bacterium]MBU4488500.1 DUF5320 family protein [Candidatus Omnitrophota bacterium]MCG2704588.1 DUF5320 family protein [Candidatus Omnitrophota bacterium]